MRRYAIIAGIVAVPLIIIGVLLFTTQKPAQTLRNISLTVWGTDDAPTVMEPLIAQYQATHPQIRITYVQKGVEGYQQELIDAWARGTGPNIFFMPNAWVSQMTQYSTPMPADLSVQAVQTTKGLLGSQSKIIVQRQTAPATSVYQDAFVDAVTKDAYVGGQLWGLPLSMDTIVTYYNKDLLADAKIFEPAKTWTELIDQITNNPLTALDPQNTILRSAVGLGTADNVPYASDLLALLMMQNGATMISADGHAAFADQSGQTALDFYTSFATPSKTNYAWSTDLPNARDMFLQGKVAYYFGTFADRTAIAASGLSWGVEPMLHLTTEGDNDAVTHTQRKVDAARYQMLMVSRASVQNNSSVAAWNFLTYLTRTTTAQQYLKATGKLAALKSLLAPQGADQMMGTYAAQLLTARTWYHGKDGVHAEQYLRDLINSVNAGQTDLETALALAAKQIESTL